jgi:hypothetical protein
MTDCEIFKEMLREEVLKDICIETIKKHQNWSAELDEKQSSDCRYTVTIGRVPSDLIIIKADAFPACLDFFKGKNGECKRADYILISEARRIVIFIEMKAGGGRGVLRQLKGASCLLKHCRDIGTQFWGEEKFLNGYEYSFVSIRRISISKTLTKQRQKSYSKNHDTPETYKQLTGRNYFDFTEVI